MNVVHITHAKHELSAQCVLTQSNYVLFGQVYIYKIVKKFQETGNTIDRPGRLRQRSVRYPQLFKYTTENLRQNPRRSCRTLATAAGVSKPIIHQVLRNDLGMKPFMMLHRWELTAIHVAMRARRKNAEKSSRRWPTVRCRISSSRTRRILTSSKW